MASPTNSAEAFKALAQHAKARRLADAMHSGHIGSDAAKSLTVEVWNQVSNDLGLKSTPSEETRALAVQMMRDREDAVLRFTPEYFRQIGVTQ